jgi:hypothetical protein
MEIRMKQMSEFVKFIFPLMVIGLLVSGCANQGYSVIASTATTIGVGISQHPSDGSIDATLGYKRAELAFVPTNRNGGEIAGTNKNGAKDSANVIMELRYTGIFSTGADSGIYQRLAVGDIAVTQNGTAVLFAKKTDGSFDAEAARVLNAVKTVPAPIANVTAIKALLSDKYKTYKEANDTANVAKFDSAATKNGYATFEAFLIEPSTSLERASAVKKALEDDGAPAPIFLDTNLG